MGSKRIVTAPLIVGRRCLGMRFQADNQNLALYTWEEGERQIHQSKRHSRCVVAVRTPITPGTRVRTCYADGKKRSGKVAGAIPPSPQDYARYPGAAD